MSKGYWKLEVLNNFICTVLFKDVNKDESLCQKLIKSRTDFTDFRFLCSFSVRASILSFCCEYPTLEERKNLAKQILTTKCWKALQNCFEKFQFIPTVLYWYLIKVKCCPELARLLMVEMELGFVSIFEYKQTSSVNKRQDILLNCILTDKD